MTHPLQSAQAAQRPIHSAWSRSHPMMKSRQTVAQQSHRRGIAFGARPHRAKRSLSLLAKVKQTTRRFRLIFEVGAADPFLQIEIEKEQLSRRRWSTVTDCYRSRYRPFSLVGGNRSICPISVILFG